HVGPEALAGGPIGQVHDGDVIEIVIDRKALTGTVNVIAADGHTLPDEIDAVLHARPKNPRLAPHESLPDDTKLWAALQGTSGGTWAGCVYDVERIIEALDI